MPSAEQKQILKMVEGGKISAEQAMKLIKALEQTPLETEVEIMDASGAQRPSPTAAPELEAAAAQARRLWAIPLGVGIGITLLSAYWLYNLVQSSNFGLWFYCAWVPFLLGVAVVAVAAGSRTARWLVVRVEQAKGQWPQKIVLGFPLPLGLAAWFLRHFGHNIGSLQPTSVDEILQALASSPSPKEPLIVNVDEGAGGERVQIYIG